MKYLVVGDAGSIFIKQFIEFVLLPQKWDIILLKEGYINDDYLRFYDENNVVVEDLWSGYWGFLKVVPYLRSSIAVKAWSRYIKKKYGEFNVLHVHGLNRSRGNIAMELRKITMKLIISVWGDEIFRHGERTLMSYRRYYDCADAITMATSQMRTRFNEFYGNIYYHKIHMNKFGIGLFDILDSLNLTRDQICSKIGISDSNKKIVLVGHNGREAQRHLEITSALKMLPLQYQKQIILVYTMTYGVKDEQYEENLKALINQLDCECVYLTNFMNEYDIACLRKVSDILIHAQLTDAFSASIQECLYSGCVVLNGSWLKYTELPECENRIVEYDKISDIPNVLTHVIDNYQEYKIKALNNTEVLRDMSSICVTAFKWLETINSLL